MSRSEVDDGGGTASGPIALHVEIVVIEPRSIAIVGEKDAFLVENQLDVCVEDVQVGTLAATQIEAGEGGQVGEVDSSQTQHASYGTDLKEEVLLEEIGCQVQQGKASFRRDGYLTGGECVREEKESKRELVFFSYQIVTLVGVLRESGVCARYARVVALGDPHLISDERVLEGCRMIARENYRGILGTFYALGHCKNCRVADHSSCAVHNFVRPKKMRT